MGMRLGNVIMGEGSVWEWDLVTWQIYSDCIEEGHLQEVKGQDELTEEQGEVVPISKGLLTLSALPKSRWHNLELLDTIRVCWGGGGGRLGVWSGNKRWIYN